VEPPADGLRPGIYTGGVTVHPWHDVPLGDHIDRRFGAVVDDDPEFEHYRDISELLPRRLLELERFFLDYKVLEHKEVSVDQLRSQIAAHDVIRKAVTLYREKFPHPGT
jgi:inorganic pyrophosphatase